MTFEEQLIAKIRANEVLYNVKNVNYRRKNDKERLWQQIAYELNSTVEECKRRWKSLRDKFIKLSRMEQLHEEQPKKWQYFESLKFLQGYNKASLSTTNFQDTVYLGEEKYVDIKCEAPLAQKFVHSDVTLTVASDCGSGIVVPSERFTTADARNLTTMPQGLSTGTGSGGRKRHLDVIELECIKIIRSAAETMQMEANAHIRRSSTQLLFEALAHRIDEANLPASRLNAIQTAVTNLVYSSL